MSLAVGVVGLANAGKTTLFNVLTGAGATVSRRENVGMAPVADERLGEVAAVVDAKKQSRRAPGRGRPGSGAQLLGNLRQVDALLLVLDGWSGTRSPEDDRVPSASSSCSQTASTSGAGWSAWRSRPSRAMRRFATRRSCSSAWPLTRCRRGCGELSRAFSGRAPSR